MDGTDVLALVGFGLLVAGVGLISVPVAMVIAGLILMAASRVSEAPNG